MEINDKTNIGAVARAASRPPAARVVKKQTEPSLFSQSDALNQALEKVPDSRTEEVEKARALIKDDRYPPPEAIQRIAKLLAMEFEQTIE